MFAALVAIASTSSATAAEVRAVPPNMLGLMLTPTGFDGKIYEPGQVDIGKTGFFSGFGNKLILIQKSGFQIKEQFGRTSPNDDEDHRCIVGKKREPMTLDVRLLFAMPDYKKPNGKEAILRMGILGNPEPTDLGGGGRVMLLNAPSVYFQQVQQQVRGKIREVCLQYSSVEAVFEAIETDGADDFSSVVRKAVGTILSENDSPLFLVDAVVSNVKPDPAVINAIAATLAMEKMVVAIQLLEDFVKEDPSGIRSAIFQAMLTREIALGASQTIIVTGTQGQGIVPIPKQ
ncbi:hypothetical protein COB52_03610 [Candidatus Kaiserbacteria bacterium]|nr:MAG: hypothetical protein COB52_03610 [Candidatus Kaiserbacteria bacterium]